MNKVLSFVLVLCCIFTVYSWVFDDSTPINAVGVAVTVDSYGNKKDVNGYIIPEYMDDELSGEFYNAGSKPLGFITDVATAFDGMRGGIVSIISTSTKMTETVVNAITTFNTNLENTFASIFNFDEIGSWWDDIWLSFESNADEEGGSRGRR